MATAYDFVSANKRRSILLVAVFVVLIVAIGYALQQLLETGPIGLVFALVFATFSSLIGYYQGDKLALFASQAHGPIEKKDQSYLYSMVENLCITTGLPMPKIYLIDDTAINAFATGRDPQHASIAVTTGAIDRLENEELEGVLAHELSHIKNYDIRFMTLVTILVGTIALISDYARHAMWFGGGKRRDSNDSGQGGAIMAILALILIILAPLIAQLIRLAVSRKREFLADASASLITRYPEGLARALEKISHGHDEVVEKANTATAPLFFSSPFGKSSIGKFLSTHPPLEERIAALRKM